MHAEVIGHLQAVKGEWPRVAEESGISLRTIEKIARLEIENPGVKTVERLAQYFRSRLQSAAAH